MHLYEEKKKKWFTLTSGYENKWGRLIHDIEFKFAHFRLEGRVTNANPITSSIDSAIIDSWKRKQD